MVISLNNGSHFAASNRRMSTNSVQTDSEEETVHQMMKDIDFGKPNSFPSNNAQEEVNTHNFYR